MNCRKLARLMPELAAGGLDEAAAAEAQEHIKACTSCAAELARYEEAFSALEWPKQMVSVPEALAALPWPEENVRSVPWGRYALAAAAAAAVLAAVVLLPHRTSPSKPQVAHHPVKPQQIAEKPLVRRDLPPAPPERHEPAASQTPERPHVVKLQHPEPEKRGIGWTPAPEIREEQQHTAEAPGNKTSPAVPQPGWVIVTAPAAAQSSIEMESTDHATGVVSTYSVTRDSSGAERVTEMTSTSNIAEDGRQRS